MTYSILLDFLLQRHTAHNLPTMQCLPTPVYLVSYIVAMQLSSPVKFHETYKNTKQKQLSYELNDKLYQRVIVMKTSPSMITMAV